LFKVTISFIEVFLRCTVNKCVLCIVPINTIANWLNEFNQWLPESGQQILDHETIINYKRPFKVHMINDFSKTFKQRSEIISKQLFLFVSSVVQFNEKSANSLEFII
jgi:SNF2 family DNA or RNA helicase